MLAPVKATCEVAPTTQVDSRNILSVPSVGPDVGMNITGLETDAMWRRYSSVREDDLEQARKVAQQYVSENASRKAETKVVSMSEVRR